jgi:hypothetical protein
VPPVTRLGFVALVQRALTVRKVATIVVSRPDPERLVAATG